MVRNNLKFAKFTTNGVTPPLEYEDSEFDFVYAVSVFTHLDDTLQFQWLLKLRRILRTEGILILTVYHQKQELEEIDELKYRIKNDKIGKVPSWSIPRLGPENMCLTITVNILKL